MVPSGNGARTPSLLSSAPSRQISINDMRAGSERPPTERTPLVNELDAVETESVAGLEHEEMLASGSACNNKLTIDKASKRRSIAKKVKQRSKYYVPALSWIPEYSLASLGGDVVSGISVACLLVPQSISYASGLATLPPVAGLWSTALGGLVYSVFGTCRQLSVGPEAALSLLVGQLINELVYGDPHAIPANPDQEAAAIAVIATFQVGLITFFLGLFRLGFLDVVLSRALLRGFVTAVGVIIFIEQLVPMLGLARHLHKLSTPPTSILKFVWVIQNLRHVNKVTMTLSLSSMTFLIFSKMLKNRFRRYPALKFIPEILVAVVATTVMTRYFAWDQRGVDVLGKIKGGKELPFGLPSKTHWKYFGQTFPTAAVMAVVGFVDSIVAAKENASKFGYPVSPNRELVALGISNFVASSLTVTGSVPVFGAITRSRLNAQTGSRSQMSSLITCSCLLVSIFVLLPYFYFLPKAVLAAIIVRVVYTILSEAPHDVMFFWRMGAWTDFLQMVGTFVLTLFFSVELGLVASVGFSLILVIQRSTETRIKIIGRLPGSDEWAPIDEDDEAEEQIPGVLVVRVRENLSFANTGQLKERLRRLELYGPHKSHPSEAPKRENASVIVFHMGDVDDIDASAIQIFMELVEAYTDRGVELYFVHLRKKHEDRFRSVGIKLGQEHFLPDLRSAMQRIEELGGASSLRM